MPYNTKSSYNSSRSQSRSGGGRSFGSGGSSFGGRGGRSGGGGGGRRKPQKQYIDPRRFVRAATPREEVQYTPTHSFEDFAVDEIIKNNLTIKGFVQPSPIQDQAIPVGLEGKDIVGIANTGTGKTAAFAIPVIDRLMHDENSKAIILAPTRELAQQIEDECREIGKRSGVFGALLIGGSPMGQQLRDLRANPRIVIGTPGRIKDHIERGTLDLRGFNIAVLDEVDRMLDMGFIEDMRFILDILNPERQSFFFSATLDHKIDALIHTFLKDPVTISVKTGDTSENVEQDVVRYAHRDEKLEKLHGILNQEAVAKVLIFDETQRSVEALSRELQNRGFGADAIHGGKSQGQRERALRRFKKNDITILVATDVAARGIDVADITHVINYTTPQAYEDYVHRIGRAGRAGRMGHALTFVDNRDF
ncbi:MAG: DEAD/DEAH box helicase [Candidatus Saccharibacteria bacterium]